MQQTGPLPVKIPARFKTEVLSCYGCEFFNAVLIKSGNNPIYGNQCKHQAAPKQMAMIGNLDVDPENHLVIPGDFCPFTK